MLGIFVFSPSAQADTIYLRDGKQLKGLVVEEYHDRVVFSQEKGEIEIMRSLIDEIFYDTQIQNYLYLGDKAFYDRKFDTALKFYKKAEQMESKGERARGAVYRTYDAITKYQMGLERYDVQDLLLDQLGISIKSVDGKIQIAKESLHATEDMSVSDYITSVSGLSTKYMNEDFVAELIVGDPSSFVKLQIEKKVPVITSETGYISFFFRSRKLGMRLSWQSRGLAVTFVGKDSPADKSGIKVGDVVTHINGKSTRYMPMKEVEKNIYKKKRKKFVFIIRRDIFIKRHL